MEDLVVLVDEDLYGPEKAEMLNMVEEAEVVADLFIKNNQTEQSINHPTNGGNGGYLGGGGGAGGNANILYNGTIYSTSLAQGGTGINRGGMAGSSGGKGINTIGLGLEFVGHGSGGLSNVSSVSKNSNELYNALVFSGGGGGGGYGGNGGNGGISVCRVYKYRHWQGAYSGGGGGGGGFGGKGGDCFGYVEDYDAAHCGGGGGGYGNNGSSTRRDGSGGGGGGGYGYAGYWHGGGYANQIDPSSGRYNSYIPEHHLNNIDPHFGVHGVCIIQFSTQYLYNSVL